MKLFLEQELHNSYLLSGLVIIVEISEVALDVYKFWKKNCRPRQQQQWYAWSSLDW